MKRSVWKAGKEIDLTNNFDEELKEDNISQENSGVGNHDAPCDEKCIDDEKVKTNHSDDVENNSKTDEQNAENEKTEKQTSKEKEDEEDANTKFIRLMADFQNYRKRADKEKSEIYARANEGIMLGLLTVIDNFERAIEHESKDEKYAEGMQLIFKQLMDVLQASGLEEIKALDEDFDPNIHDAVMTCDSDEHESGKVVEVLQKGYMLNGRLLRASMVKVSN